MKQQRKPATAPKAVVRNIIFGTGLALLGAFGTHAVYADADRALDVQRVSSNNGRVVWAQVQRAADGQLRVSGWVEKRFNARGRIPGELRIELLANDGSVIEQMNAPYYRHRAKSRRAFFDRYIASPETQQVSSVRITHIGLQSPQF